MAALLAGTAVACRDDGPTATIDPTVGVEQSPTNVAAPAATSGALTEAQLLAATVDVRAAGCGPRVRLGTGGVIDETLIVTAAHVVAGSEQIEVTGAAGHRTVATMVLLDPANDVAVLRTPTAVGEPVPVRTDPARAGEMGVVVISRLVDGRLDLQMQDVTVVRPVTIRTTDIYRLDDVERTGFELGASIEPGDSGTMVNLPGGGAGIVWARSNERSDRAWAVRLPAVLLDAELRGRLVDPVDVGNCVD
jgi:S1-C subfamily serine protease